MSRFTHRIDQIHTQRATFQAGSGLTFEGRTVAFGTTKRFAPVKFSGEMEVVLCADGDIPEGSIERIEPDGSVVVNYHGAVPFANGNDTPVEAGDTDLLADGAGNIVVASGDDVGDGSTRKVVSVVGDVAWVLFQG